MTLLIARSLSRTLLPALVVVSSVPLVPSSYGVLRASHECFGFPATQGSPGTMP